MLDIQKNNISLFKKKGFEGQRMFYPAELIETIRMSNDIYDVVSEYVRLERKGTKYFGLCPFHSEKTPSFCVTPSKQIFYCFGCGKGGNVIHFIMNIENLDYVEAVKHLAERARIVLPDPDDETENKKAHVRKILHDINVEAARYFHSVLVSHSGLPAFEYLKRRGIKKTTITRFGLGYSPNSWDSLYKYLKSKGFNDEELLQSGLVVKSKSGSVIDMFRNRVIFPIFDVRGKVIAFGGRAIDDSKPKYINSPDTLIYNKRRNLYALNFAKSFCEETLILVEGYMDVVSLHQNSVRNAVATLGTALTESQARLINKYTRQVVLAYDTDNAGKAAAERAIDMLCSSGCIVKVMSLPEGKDPDEYMKNHGNEKFTALVSNALPHIEYKIMRLKEQFDVSTTEGRVLFLNQCAYVLAGVENSVEREMYIKYLSEEYNISPEAIINEVRKININAGQDYGANQKNVLHSGYRVKNTIYNGNEISLNDKIKQEERFILALLVKDNKLISIIEGKIDEGWFTDSNNINVAQKIFMLYNTNKQVSVAELLNAMPPDVADDFLTILNKHCLCEDNLKALNEKIKSVTALKLKNRQAEILQILSDPSGISEEKIQSLKQELKDLITMLRNIKCIG